MSWWGEENFGKNRSREEKKKPTEFASEGGTSSLTAQDEVRGSRFSKKVKKAGHARLP
jgi:hypothetical protein